MSEPAHRTLLIGQAPGPRTDPELPLYPIPSTSTGGRLARLMGLRRWEYLSLFDRMNLLPYHPGRHRRDDKFPMVPARLAARVLLPLLAGRRVVLVGRGVAKAFGVGSEFHEWGTLRVGKPCAVTRCRGTAVVAVVPHPSGRNYWYNDPSNVLVAQEFWAQHIQGIRPDARNLLSSVTNGRMEELSL